MKNNIYTSFEQNKTLFSALLDACGDHGKQYKIIEDVINDEKVSIYKVSMKHRCLKENLTCTTPRMSVGN